MNYSHVFGSVLSLSLAACGGGGGGSEASDGSTGTAASTGEAASTGDTPTSSATTGVPEGAPVVLNEVLSKAALDGPYVDRGDAVEVYNRSDATVDLTGWKLSDDPTFAADKTYVFPPGSALAPGGFLVLVELDAMGGAGDLPFGLSSTAEETITLADAGAVFADQLIVNGAEAERSYCRVPDGTGDWQPCDQTLGAANAVASATCGNAVREPGEPCDGEEFGDQTCAGLGLGFTGGLLLCTASCALDPTYCESATQVVINEFETNEDKIEIYNFGAAMIDIAGWVLTDKFQDASYIPDEDLEKLTFPAPTNLKPGEFLTIGKGVLPGQHKFGLSADGDTVSLLLPDFTVADQVVYGVGEAAVSYCALPDGPTGTWTAGCKATFGLPNSLP